MLNDIERRKLADIESCLSTEDPQLARQFGAGFQRSPGRRAAIIFSFGVAVVVSVWLGALVAGVADGIAVGLLMCAIAWGWLIERRTRPGMPPGIRRFED